MTPLQFDALHELSRCSSVATRCVMAGVSFPQTWQDYVAELRGVLAGRLEVMPARPAYPTGT